jgi:hypothetical protein
MFTPEKWIQETFSTTAHASAQEESKRCAKYAVAMQGIEIYGFIGAHFIGI